MSQPTIVLKFGSSVLRTAAELPLAVHEIFRYAREGFGVVAVVSAFEGVTDRLIAQARDLGADPAHDVGVPGLAALVASGERETAASLQIALSRAGLLSNVLDPLAAGLRVQGNGIEGCPVDLQEESLTSLLDRGRIVIVPGFFGADEDGSVSLLGRGGSDWTALFLAQRLHARCRLLKDTDGIYERDPNGTGEAPLRFERLNYEDALALKAPVVQEAALRFALSHAQKFEVARLGSGFGTTVGPHSTLLARRSDSQTPRLRVTLLGLGAVGRGVYEHLLRQDGFEIVAIAVRDRARHEASGIPGDLLHPLEEALRVPSDIVIEAIGGAADAGRALSTALADGRHVVTANKAVMAAWGIRLRAIADRDGTRLSYSSAVGGVVPVLETLRGLRGQVVRIEGVLNGTSNFVLDRLVSGASIEDAVAEARRLGYAEADPTDDLSGLDAARKLTLIARDAFGASPDAETIPIPGPSAIAAWRPGPGAQLGRLIARVERGHDESVAASVQLLSVAPSHPLAACRGAHNAVVITLKSGRTIELRGKGAGRWPTAESVMGDLLEIGRELRARLDPRTSVLGEFEAAAS